MDQNYIIGLINNFTSLCRAVRRRVVKDLTSEIHWIFEDALDTRGSRWTKTVDVGKREKKYGDVGVTGGTRDTFYENDIPET